MSTIELTKKINNLSREDYDIVVALVNKLYNYKISCHTNEELPNDITLNAIREADDICKHPDRYKQYSSAEELMNEVYI